MNRTLISGRLLVFIPILFCADLNASSICASSKPTFITQLDKVYFADSDLRIFYTDNGLNAISSIRDENRNNVPDYIENIAIQANSVRRAWNHLGYQDPLNSPRYKDIEYIDIHVRKLNGLGLAYDKPHRHTNHPIKKNACALILEVNSNIANFTTESSLVAHELFHLYTYGYTMFKQPWLTESIAAWSEGLITKGNLGAYGQRKLPNTVHELNKYVLARTYKSSQLWNRLTLILDQSKGQLNLPSNISHARYVDGQPVFRDQSLKGSLFIRTFLENLSKQDKYLSRHNNWRPYEWKESLQRSSALNVELFSVLLKTIDLSSNQNKELRKFEFVLNSYINNEKIK